MSIATFESPEVATQQFFPWVFDEDADCGSADAESFDDFAVEVNVVCPPPVPASVVSKSATKSATETRLGKPVRLGAVMIKLLKSYGITDEEIAAGMAAYAANDGLAKAG